MSSPAGLYCWIRQPNNKPTPVLLRTAKVNIGRHTTYPETGERLHMVPVPRRYLVGGDQHSWSQRHLQPDAVIPPQCHLQEDNSDQRRSQRSDRLLLDLREPLVLPHLHPQNCAPHPNPHRKSWRLRVHVGEGVDTRTYLHPTSLSATYQRFSKINRTNCRASHRVESAFLGRCGCKPGFLWQPQGICRKLLSLYGGRHTPQQVCCPVIWHALTHHPCLDQ